MFKNILAGLILVFGVAVATVSVQTTKAEARVNVYLGLPGVYIGGGPSYRRSRCYIHRHRNYRRHRHCKRRYNRNRYRRSCHWRWRNGYRVRRCHRHRYRH